MFFHAFSQIALFDKKAVGPSFGLDGFGNLHIVVFDVVVLLGRCGEVGIEKDS